jgi:ADP-heptose:LPS heptosyltransferase
MTDIRTQSHGAGHSWRRPFDPGSLRAGTGVLVLDHHGLGNVVMSIPLLRALAGLFGRKHPVYVLLQSQAHYELIQAEGLDVMPLLRNPDYQGWRGWLRLLAAMAGRIGLVVAAPNVPLHRILSVRAALGARYCAGESPRRRWLLSVAVEKTWDKPILDSQCEIVRALGFDGSVSLPAIRVRQEEAEWAEGVVANRIGRRRPILGLHCSAINPIKHWGARQFGAVAAELKNHFPDLAVISFGSGSERQDDEAARSVAGDVFWVPAGGLWSIRQSLAMLQRCDLVVSGDTGVMHMAAAVGTRTLSVFGPTSASRVVPCYNDGAVITPCDPRPASGGGAFDSILPGAVAVRAAGMLNTAATAYQGG